MNEFETKVIELLAGIKSELSDIGCVGLLLFLAIIIGACQLAK